MSVVTHEVHLTGYGNSADNSLPVSVAVLSQQAVKLTAVTATEPSKMKKVSVFVALLQQNQK